MDNGNITNGIRTFISLLAEASRRTNARFRTCNPTIPQYMDDFTRNLEDLAGKVKLPDGW